MPKVIVNEVDQSRYVAPGNNAPMVVLVPGTASFGPTFTETNPDATFKAMKPGILYIRGYVVDSNGLKSWYSQKVKVTVSEPEPYISLNVPDHQKELRKFTVDLSGSGTTCDSYYSSFTPITGHYTEMTPAIDWTLTNI